MIYFPDIGCIGRLGNQMFQLATLKALSLESGEKAYLPVNLNERETANQKCLLDYFIHGLEKRDIDLNEKYTMYSFPTHEDRSVNRSDFINIKNFPIWLDGYPESELFFLKYKNEIKKCFEIKPEREDIVEFAKEYVDTLKNKKNKQIVALHIRRGDNIPLIDEKYWNDFSNYVKQFTEHFSNEEYHFLVFVGGSRAENCDNTDDIQWCKKIFKDWENLTICEINDTIRELEIMKNCDHMILTDRSTFSWWGAYLIKNPNKKVLVPKKVPFGVGISNPDIFWSSEFTQIEVTAPE